MKDFSANFTTRDSQVYTELDNFREAFKKKKKNVSKRLEMDFKHNFSQCNILTRETPPMLHFFFEGFTKGKVQILQQGGGS